MSLNIDATSVSASLLLLDEQVSVARRRLEGDTVRVSTLTNTTEEHVAKEIVPKTHLNQARLDRLAYREGSLKFAEEPRVARSTSTAGIMPVDPWSKI